MLLLLRETPRRTLRDAIGHGGAKEARDWISRQGRRLFPKSRLAHTLREEELRANKPIQRPESLGGPSGGAVYRNRKTTL